MFIGIIRAMPREGGRGGRQSFGSTAHKSNISGSWAFGNVHFNLKWPKNVPPDALPSPSPTSETSCGTSPNPETPTTYASTHTDTQVHDSQVARRAEVHGSASGTRVPPAGCRNRAALPVSGVVQDEVPPIGGRFRESERVELDRHSYEVQICELTDRLAEEHNFRTEIEKLREFIRRQSVHPLTCRQNWRNFKIKSTAIN